MPRYDDRYSSTRLYVGHLSSRTRTRDLEDIFSRYGRVRDVDMKRDYAFVEFSDPRDADDARYALNGRDFDGSRIIVEFAKGAPRGPGGSRDFGGRGPPPGAGRCFNCGLDGHWARDCKAGDWKNKCYRCGERGHIERNCQNSPKKLRRGDSDSRSPSPRRRGRSFSRSRSYSRSRSPPKRQRSIGYDDRSRSPRRRSPKRQKVSPLSSRSRKRSLSPDDRSPRRAPSFSPDDRSPRRGRSLSPDDRSPRRGPSLSPDDRSPRRGRSLSPDDRSPRRAPSLSPDDRSPRKGPSLSPDDRSPRRGRSLSPREGDRKANGSDSPRAKSRSPGNDAGQESPRDRNGRSPFEENGGSGGRSPAPVVRNGRSGRVDDENEDY